MLHNIRKQAFLHRARQLNLVIRRDHVPRNETLLSVAQSFVDIWKNGYGVTFQEPELPGGPLLRGLVPAKKGALNVLGFADLVPSTISITDTAADLGDGRNTFGRRFAHSRMPNEAGEETFLFRLSKWFRISYTLASRAHSSYSVYFWHSPYQCCEGSTGPPSRRTQLPWSSITAWFLHRSRRGAVRGGCGVH